MPSAEAFPAAALALPGGGGLIGICRCPGSRPGPPPPGPRGASLDADLASLRAWGAEILLSLVEDFEFGEAGVPELPARMPPGLELLRLPIRDVSIPDAAWERSWEREGPRVRDLLRRGGLVCVHCMGGKGRSGLLAAGLLVEAGLDPEEAIARVRAARPGAVETRAQEDWVRAHRLPAG